MLSFSSINESYTWTGCCRLSSNITSVEHSFSHIQTKKTMVTASSLSTATRPSWTWFLVFPIFLLDGQILLQPATAFSIFQRHNKYDASLTVIRQIPSRETSCTTSSRRPSFPFSLIGGGRSRRRRSGGKYNIYEDSCLALYSSSKSSQQQSEVEDGDFVEAEDLPAIQALFNKYCDKDGLMTKADLTSIPVFADMLVSFINFVVWMTSPACVEREREGLSTSKRQGFVMSFVVMLCVFCLHYLLALPC